MEEKSYPIHYLGECEKNELDMKEIYWIGYYKTYTNGYNATIGGDGGKTCQSYRDKFGKITTEEVIYLRKRFRECKYPKSIIYEKEFSHKISKRGFNAIWTGDKAKNIMPEVFDEQTKKKRLILEREYEGALRRRISLQELLECKKQIKAGIKCKTLWRQKYQDLYSYGGFRDLMKTTPLDERINFDEDLSPL